MINLHIDTLFSCLISRNHHCRHTVLYMVSVFLHMYIFLGIPLLCHTHISLNFCRPCKVLAMYSKQVHTH